MLGKGREKNQDEQRLDATMLIGRVGKGGFRKESRGENRLCKGFTNKNLQLANDRTDLKKLKGNRSIRVLQN